MSFVACKGDSGPGASASGIMYVTAKSGLNLRAKPSASAKKTGALPAGSRVTVLRRMPNAVTIGGKSGHWTKVKGIGGTGWAFGAYLTSKKTATPAAAPGSPGNLSGKYESDCDPEVTLEFKSGSKVRINTNVCEGYEYETRPYTQSGSRLALGKGEHSEIFHIRADGNLEYRPNKFSLITCGNCNKGHVWKKK